MRGVIPNSYCKVVEDRRHEPSFLDEGKADDAKKKADDAKRADDKSLGTPRFD